MGRPSTAALASAALVALVVAFIYGASRMKGPPAAGGLRHHPTGRTRGAVFSGGGYASPRWFVEPAGGIGWPAWEGGPPLCWICTGACARADPFATSTYCAGCVVRCSSLGI
jgi:hypothetical protein